MVVSDFELVEKSTSSKKRMSVFEERDCLSKD